MATNGKNGWPKQPKPQNRVPPNVPQPRAAAPTLAGTAAQLRGKGPTRTKPGRYQGGDVIKTVHFAPNMNPHSVLDNITVATTRNAGPVVGKERPFIVLAVTETHLKCIPMFTSGSQGFVNKEARIQWECIYLRTWDDIDHDWDEFTPREYLMTEPNYTAGVGSYAMWTRTYDVQYEWPIVVMGAISNESYIRLALMHQIGYRMGESSLKLQKEIADKELDRIEVYDEFTKMRNFELGLPAPPRVLILPRGAPATAGTTSARTVGGGAQTGGRR